MLLLDPPAERDHVYLYCERPQTHKSAALLDVGSVPELRNLWEQIIGGGWEDDDTRSMVRVWDNNRPPWRSFREGVWYRVPMERAAQAFAAGDGDGPDADEPGANALIRGSLYTSGFDAADFSTGMASPYPEDRPQERSPWDPGALDRLQYHAGAKGREPVLRVVNCGQGNWNELHHEDWLLVYDTGCSAGFTHGQRDAFMQARHWSHEKRPIHVVISHWDVDHYHALLSAAPADLAAIKTFTAPPIPGNATSRAVLAALTAAGVRPQFLPPAARPNPSDRRIVLVPQPARASPVPEVVLFRATGGASRNQTGITLAYQGPNSTAILTGDHHFQKVFEVLQPRLPASARLVVPHHGGRAGRFDIADWRGIGDLLAAISVGTNSYGHPLPELQLDVAAAARAVATTQTHGDILLGL